MKRFIILVILLLGSVATGVAQDDVPKNDDTSANWQISARGLYGVMNSSPIANGGGFSLALGRYIDENKTTRANFFYEYVFAEKSADWQIASLTLSEDLQIFNVKNLITEVSLGLGYMTNSLSFRDNPATRFYDVVIPVGVDIGYQVNKTISVGISGKCYLNCMDLFNRTPSSWGIYVGFKF